MRTRFEKRLQLLETTHKELIQKSNKKLESENGIYNRYSYPVLTPQHTPIFWRYDLNYETNPYLMERYNINTVTNAGAIKLNGKFLLVAGIEGADGKSFFAVAESSNGIDNFEFWDYPLTIPEGVEPDENGSDMRIVLHEDGWIYGIFTIEKRSPASKTGAEFDTIQQCGIIRTTDLKTWERLPDLKALSSQHCSIILHPEFVNGKYAFYIVSKDGFGPLNENREIRLRLTDSITKTTIEEEPFTDQVLKDVIYEPGPAPLKTQYGWLHLVHEVRNTTSGVRKALSLYMTDLKDLTNTIYKPAGYLLIPEENERTSGILGPVFCNGWMAADDGTIYIYYNTLYTGLHVATTTLDQLLDFVMNTSADISSEPKSTSALYRVIDNNKALMQLKQSSKDKTTK